MKKCLLFIVVLFSILLLFSCTTETETTKLSQTVTTTAATTEPTQAITTSTNKKPTTTTPTDQPIGELHVHFIDVGQGDSILIDYGDTEVLIDGGGRSPSVVSYLSGYVDGAIEVMVATHPHADHIGGLIKVLDNYEVNEINSSSIRLKEPSSWEYHNMLV